MYFLCFLTERVANVPNRLAPVKNYFPGIFSSQLTALSLRWECWRLETKQGHSKFPLVPAGVRLGGGSQSSPNRDAITVVYAADPNGASRCMLCWKSGSRWRGLCLLYDEEGAFGVCRKLDEIDMTVAQEPFNHRG